MMEYYKFGKKLDCSQDYRIDFLKELPKNAVCAEIGVHKGDWSKEIIKITKPKELWLIDHWYSKDPKDPRASILIKNYFQLRKKTKIVIKQGFLEDINIPNDYFDWVYLDTEHIYEDTTKQLPICFNMVKNNGLITGDDYGHFAIPPFEKDHLPYFEGHTKAVDEFVESYSDSIQIDYLNKNEINNSKQFKIVKKI